MPEKDTFVYNLHSAKNIFSILLRLTGNGWEAAIGNLLEPEKKPVDADVPALSVDTINKMRELELKDNFANMYLDDPFLIKYPPETVLDAYNKVMQMVPTIGRRQNADALITSMVKRLITSNNGSSLITSR
jgi:hypothetical protein